MGDNDSRAGASRPISASWSRRRFLRAAGITAGAVGLAPVLAACGSDSGSTGFAADPSGIVDFANWSLYVDRAKDANGVRYSPFLRSFTAKTGIEVNYREVIQDAAGFFEQIQSYLAAGEPTGWDIIVMTNGATLTKMINLGYLEELPSDLRPNFDRNASEAVRDPAYDPGNRFSMAWQSGITGLAYNPKVTGRRITSVRDLFDPAFAGKVGMFGDSLDLPNFALLAVGADPETSTPDDWKNAADLLVKQRKDGLVRDYYLQNYVNPLSRGDLAVSMAWSGDVFQENLSGAADGLQFVVPEEGALLWTDAMCVPKGALHPADAITYMDFVYRPDIAADIASWVNYITPVPAAQQVLLERADADASENGEFLRDVAGSELVFPTDDTVDRLRTYRVLDDAEEVEWNRLFSSFYS